FQDANWLYRRNPTCLVPNGQRAIPREDQQTCTTRFARTSRDSSTATEAFTSNSFDDVTTSTVIRFAPACAFTRARAVKRVWSGSRNRSVAGTSVIELDR